MKKPVELLIVFILLVGVLGIVSAGPLPPVDPACKGLCNAFSKCDKYSPQYWVLATHVMERDCDLYCKAHINDSMSCDGLYTAAVAVGLESPACRVIRDIMVGNSCTVVDLKDCKTIMD